MSPSTGIKTKKRKTTINSNTGSASNSGHKRVKSSNDARAIASDDAQTAVAATPSHSPPLRGGLGLRLRQTILEILSTRAAGATCCPSEAPRHLFLQDWRQHMDLTREVAREMAYEGVIEITQKGNVLDPSKDIKGPIRLRLKMH